PAGRGPLSFADSAQDNPLAPLSFINTERQPLSAVGNTHASSVIVVVNRSDGASLTVTQFVVPLKDRAPPNRPDPVHEAPVIVPLLLLPERSPATVPLASSNPY